MLSETDFTLHVRTPFAVKATKITEANIDDIAKALGEVRVKKGEKYIVLDRRIVPNIGQAFIGWWVTALGGNIRCYSPKVFEKQFVELPLSGELVSYFKDSDIDLPFLFEKTEV